MSNASDNIYTVIVQHRAERGCVVVRCPFCLNKHIHKSKGVVMAICLGGRYRIIEPLKI